MKATELINKYNLGPDSYDLRDVDFFKDYESVVEKYQIKYKDRIQSGWYGFYGLSEKTPFVWFLVIDEFLQYVETECPHYKILQIKTKFGGLRMYLENITEDVRCEIDLLEEVMTDEKLFY